MEKNLLLYREYIFFLEKCVVVEWFERLDYGAESRRKVVSLRLGFAMRRLENSVNPAVNGYLFRIRKAKEAKGEGWAPPFISCVQDTVGL